MRQSLIYIPVKRSKSIAFVKFHISFQPSPKVFLRHLYAFSATPHHFIIPPSLHHHFHQPRRVHHPCVWFSLMRLWFCRFSTAENYHDSPPPLQKSRTNDRTMLQEQNLWKGSESCYDMTTIKESKDLNLLNPLGSFKCTGWADEELMAQIENISEEQGIKEMYLRTLGLLHTLLEAKYQIEDPADH